MSQEELSEIPAPDPAIEPEIQPTSKARGIPVRTKIYTGFGGFLLFMLATTLFFYYNFRTVEVRGESMEPTLHSGNRLLVSSAYWLIGAISDDDIVVIKNNVEDDFIIKRVYKTEGQEVDPEFYPDGHDLTSGPYIVPKGTIYVIGDNFSVSQDSRHYGPFELSDVVGKVVVVRSALNGSAKAESE